MIKLIIFLCLTIGYIVNGQQLETNRGGAQTTRNHPIYQRGDTRNQQQQQQPRNVTSSFSTSSSTSGGSANDLNILNRINDRITALFALEEQQLQRLEGLEYKMTRFEVTFQERTDSIRTEITELATKIEEINYTTKKLETFIENQKTDLDILRDSVDRLTTSGCINQQMVTGQQQLRPALTPATSDNSVNYGEILDGLSTTVTSARIALHRVERDIGLISGNISNIYSLTKDINQLQRIMPTKQFLNNAVHSFRNTQPVYAVLQQQTGRQGVNSINGELTDAVTSCSEVPSIKSGVYQIQTNGLIKNPFFVYCDLETNFDKWTVILNRMDGSINFYRNWLEYRNGFGNINGEFWIGLDKLHELTTSQLHELYIVLEDKTGTTKTAKYSAFAIAGEREDYVLNVLGSYEGDAGDSLHYHAGQKFSTFDSDNDGWLEGNCAQAHSGGWWYNSCDMSNLNGKYLNGDVTEQFRYQGVYWNDFRGSNYSLKSAKMMIRPVEQ